MCRGRSRIRVYEGQVERQMYKNTGAAGAESIIGGGLWGGGVSPHWGKAPPSSPLEKISLGLEMRIWCILPPICFCTVIRSGSDLQYACPL